MKTSKPLSLLLSLLTALAVLSGSIAAPLLCRPFYYAHIDALGLVEYTGLTREQITEAFDQMMDYCLGPASELCRRRAPLFSLRGQPFCRCEGAVPPGPVGTCTVPGRTCGPVFLVQEKKGLAPIVFLDEVPDSGPRPRWVLSSWWWADWRPWTLTGPLWCSMLCFSQEKRTGF